MSKFALPQDCITYHIKAWTILVSVSTRTVYIINGRGKIRIVRDSTYNIRSLPKYVQKYIDRHHILDLWKDKQKEDSLNRLKDLSVRQEEMNRGYVRKTWTTAP